jgi:hypothetical protein
MSDESEKFKFRARLEAEQEAEQGTPTPRTTIDIKTGPVKSALSRFAHGAIDPINEAATMLPKGLQAVTSLGGNYPNPVSNFFGSEASRVQDMNKANEAEYKAANTGLQGTDVARLAGNVLSPTNLAVASKIPMVLRGANAVKAGAAAGTVGGATEQTDVNAPNYWANKAIETGKGTVIGAGTSGLLAGGARIVKPEPNAKVAELLRQGVTPTPGQTLGGIANTIEEKLQSVPILGDAISWSRKKANEEFVTGAMNKALKPIGESTTKTGREAINEVESKLSKAYKDILPKISFVPDAQWTADYGNFQKLVSGLAPTEHKAYTRIMDDVMHHASPNGQMTGETFKIASSQLAKKAADFTSSATAYERELGDALNGTLDAMKQAVYRANPQYADRLKAVDTGYANFVRLQAASKSTNVGAKEGVFSPAQLAAGVLASDKSLRKGASARGNALMQDYAELGTNVLGNKVPDSGTAGRLALLAGGSGAAGYAGFGEHILPVAGALGVASLPYLPVGRNIASAILTKRPEQAQMLADAIRKANPLLSGSAAMIGSNQGN